MARFIRSLLNLFRGRNVDSDMSEELRLHLEQRIAEGIADGLSPEESRYAALRSFGGVDQFKEDARHQRPLHLVEQVGKDLVYALRQLRKSPGFAFVAIATLAVCIGANSAIFSIVNAVLLKPFPYPESQDLVYVSNSYPKIGLEMANVSIPDYLDRIERAPSIESAMLYEWVGTNLTTDGRPSRIAGIRATPSMFKTLRVAPAIGRQFDESNAVPGNDRVVVLSHSLWQDKFGGRDGTLGATIRLNGESYTVIGIMPPDFFFPEPGQKLWTPYAFTDEKKSDLERGNEYSWMIARIKPGATTGQLEKECATIIDQNLQRLPELRPLVEATGFRAAVSSMPDVWLGDVRSTLWLLQAGVLAALLIGCANVANLLLTRAVSRERELAVRLALGASRWRLVRQLLIESLALFLAGGAFGLVVATWGLSAMNAFGVADLPRGNSVQLDLPVFAFTLLSAGITGLIFGIVPALQASRANASDALREAGARTTASRRHQFMRNGLVVGEVALSLMLLTTAGLLFRSFQRLQAQDPGFDGSSVLTARLNLPETAYDTDQKVLGFSETLFERLGAIPGIESVGATTNIPFGYTNSQGSYNIDGLELPEGQPQPHGMIRSVSANYFSALSIPVIRGRSFGRQDTNDSEPVVIIDRVLAERYWPDEDPIGEQIYRGEPRPENMCTIVGVVAPVKQVGLDDSIPKETIYYPFTQRPTNTFSIVVRTAVEPYSILPELRRTIRELDPEQPLFEIDTMAARIEASTLRQRISMQLIGLFSAMALLLAAIGVYGVLAFGVGQRTREFGIRMALGAVKTDVVRLVLRHGLVLVGTGIVLGIAGYAAVSRLLAHLVFEIEPLDPVSLIIAPVALLIVALIACLLPARRATAIDPAITLRNE